MPRLHQYENRPGCYVLTSINGRGVTFQLTPEGERKLIAAGIGPDQQFPRALLLDLYRSGDAYTYSTGVDEPTGASVNQMELDFAQDPDPDTAFPSCEDCDGVNDLHLVVMRERGTLIAKLQCPICRDKTSANLDTCIPVSLLSLSLLGHLIRLKKVTKKYESVSCYEELLQAEFESKWEELRKLRSASQESLFDIGLSDELNLSPPKRKTPGGQ